MHKDSYFVEMSFDNAQEFLESILEQYDCVSLMDLLGPGMKHVIFRGVDDAKHENLPRAFRRGLDWDRFDFYAPLPLDTSGGDKAKANFLFDHRQAELRSVFSFLNYSDKLGISTPLNFYNLDNELYKALQVEEGASYDYLTRSPHLNYPFPGEGVSEAFALAQHYGVPTRLLDWTESPQVAMFFAAAMSWREILAYAAGYRGIKRTAKREFITVYALGHTLIKKLNLRLVQATRHQNPRLRAQAGLFVLDPYSDVFFMNEGRWPSLEDRVEELEKKEEAIGFRSLLPEVRLVKWNLLPSESCKLAKLLLGYNVSLETMFPSLESAALAFAYRQKIAPREVS